MRIRFGYVANALGLWNASPSKSLTFARYSVLGKDERLDKLHEVTSENLEHTKRILHYNIAHEIKLYRFSSSLVPLATHPEVDWDFVSPFMEKWAELGRLVKRYGIRPSFHPNQFTLFTSPREDVTANAIKDMKFHYRMLSAMGVEDNALINIHIGGAYGDKNATLLRFHDNLVGLPEEIKRITTLENDDKTYNVMETLEACEREGIRMVLDYHHHLANPIEVELDDAFLARIFNTWANSGLVPKIHVSSPKSDSAFRSHADFVDLEFVLPFLKTAKALNQDFDIMIEAKQKNLAMHQLVEEVAAIRGVKRVGSSMVEW